MTPRLLLILLLALPVLTWRIARPGFSDTEGMFAEPAREMVLTGDWITPRMNGEPFLTKPPVMYWLPAALFSVTGPTEYARLWPALAALATVAVTGALGAELFEETVGVTAAVVLATSLGFLVEARLLRADMPLVLTVTLALYCYVRLRRGGGIGTAVAFWVTIGIGLLDKGFLALLLPGSVIAVAEIAAGDLRPRTLGAGLRALHARLGLGLVVAIAVPWCGLVALRNPGFVWDAVVNQQLLRLFNAELPRDFVPDSFGFFWAMFLVRTLPWSLLLPAALLHASRAVAGRPALRLPVVWIAVVLAFFSLIPSRLEHYSLPALPAVALVVSVFLVDGAAGRARVGRAWAIAPLAAGALLSLGFATRDPSALIAQLDPTLSAYHLSSLVRPAAVTLAAGLGTLVLLLAVQRARAVVPVGACTAVVFFGFVQVAHERVEPLFSWRPFARTIRESVSDQTPIFFRASDEYQLCGGLDYYTGRYVLLLSPANWVPPTYLAGRTDRLFATRAAFERAWHDGPAALVADDVALPGDEAEIVSAPYTLVARRGSRVLLGSGVALAHDRVGIPGGEPQ
jgi:4-amino-4-deoxy-L-arabinose transferase-like glycosyltransferase